MSDEFSEGVKRVLASRVGNVCSYPKCRALTSGPQVDPTKALNVGVAAHITAVSPGGPRYDPTLSSEQRSGHENGIWLCQTHAKLVDNDPTRFTPEELRKWKRNAEQEALDRIGRTRVEEQTSTSELKPGRRVVIRPIIPINFETEQFLIKEVNRESFEVEKPSSGHKILIPRGAVQKIMSWGDFQPPWIMLDGRLQWRSKSRTWVYLPEQPPLGPVGRYGVWKSVWMFGQDVIDTTRNLEARWVSERDLARYLSDGCVIFYDEDGLYLRNSDRSGDLILICKQPL